MCILLAEIHTSEPVRQSMCRLFACSSGLWGLVPTSLRMKSMEKSLHHRSKHHPIITMPPHPQVTFAFLKALFL
jgi:hypothetical protein